MSSPWLAVVSTVREWYAAVSGVKTGSGNTPDMLCCCVVRGVLGVTAWFGCDLSLRGWGGSAVTGTVRTETAPESCKS